MKTRQGRFGDRHNRFFGSRKGAYTAITSAEISKQTYNIKSAIKKMLVETIGDSNIPRSDDGSDQKMLFNIWPSSVGINSISERIVCKYSKPNKDEMSIYLSRLVPKSDQQEGDIWFIFFRDGDAKPWIGYMRAADWNSFFPPVDQIDWSISPDEQAHLDSLFSSMEETDLPDYISENSIIYGAPGTGKSHLIDKAIPDNKIRVTFHPEYTYYDFVGTYKPTPLYKEKGPDKLMTIDGQEANTGEPIIDYRFVPGPFTRALVRALRSDSFYYLIIEEINRANAAAVFGDLFQLLDRNSDGRSEYKITPDPELMRYIKKEVPDYDEELLYLPSNLYILATMNSADQGVFPLDSAFKRRWSFTYMPIDFDECGYRDESVKYMKKEIAWEEFVTKINDKLGKELRVSEDRFIGPFFLKKGEPSNPDIISSKLLMYLWDDVARHNPYKLFVKDISTFAELVELYKGGQKIFSDIEFSFKKSQSNGTVESRETPQLGEAAEPGEIKQPDLGEESAKKKTQMTRNDDSDEE